MKHFLSAQYLRGSQGSCWPDKIREATKLGAQGRVPCDLLESTCVPEPEALSLGFKSAGFDIVAAVDIDPIHCATHEFNFPYCATICRSVLDICGAEIRPGASPRPDLQWFQSAPLAEARQMRDSNEIVINQLSFDFQRTWQPVAMQMFSSRAKALEKLHYSTFAEATI